MNEQSSKLFSLFREIEICKQEFCFFKHIFYIRKLSPDKWGWRHQIVSLSEYCHHWKLNPVNPSCQFVSLNCAMNSWWKVLSRSNIGANVSSEGRIEILPRKIKTWNRFKLLVLHMDSGSEKSKRFGPISSDFHSLTERRFYRQVAFRTPFPT